jgi:hypothetical protein
MVHTTGEWVFKPAQDIFLPRIFANGYPIAAFAQLSNEADGVLMAAAPDLLDALEACFDNASLFNRDTDSAWVAVRDMCQAAIAKARGQE